MPFATPAILYAQFPCSGPLGVFLNG
ncbi:hypothetical protein CABS03_03023 [Colletotrichum abscissum]|uniref:Uncharacterized protein n=1 Tax=Colletotrichum abscissum TaxID=1671311 RepID=A0A9P9XKG6_9PEZI|nr:hypothetical protein CABS02_04185 [Colletotrichum abscissum]